MIFFVMQDHQACPSRIAGSMVRRGYTLTGLRCGGDTRKCDDWSGCGGFREQTQGQTGLDDGEYGAQ